MHKHKCPRCGNVWQHGDNNAGDAQAHMCPECGYGPVWLKMQNWAQRHHRAVHNAHDCAHVCYLTLVCTHGPYYIPAGALLALILLSRALRVEP